MAEHLLQQLISNGYAGIKQHLDLAVIDDELALKQHFAFNRARRRFILGRARRPVIIQARDRSPPIVNQKRLHMFIQKDPVPK